MKVASPIEISFREARQLESEKNWEEAARIYEQLIRLHPLHETYYDRLMIIYRKLGLYKKELAVVKKGIASFTKLYRRPVSKNKKVVSISKALQKATGLVDKSGSVNYEPPPLDRWKKRLTRISKLAED
jgi:hypothetical protein